MKKQFLHIELVSVGSELLTGKTNTHAAMIGTRLSACGLSLAAEHTVGDDRNAMVRVFKTALASADVVLCSGGLGPTFDDITREAWASVLRRPLLKSPPLIVDIRAKFQRRGLLMPPANLRQASVLRGARVLTNTVGTAPGQSIDVRGKNIFLLPGPWRELGPMFERDVLPALLKRAGDVVSRQKTFLIFGVAESRIDQLVRPLVRRFQVVDGCAVTHGILASEAIVSVKIRVDGRSRGEVESVLSHVAASFRRILSPYSFGEDNDTLPQVIGGMLLTRKKTLAVAESCTGGLLSSMVVDNPGASAYFQEGLVCYSNQSKTARLGVPAKVITRYGAVSKQTAAAMASGMQKKSGCDYALSVTGIAGPAVAAGAPAVLQKPAGLVYIGCATRRRVVVEKRQFFGDRTLNRRRAAMAALDLLRRLIKRNG